MQTDCLMKQLHGLFRQPHGTSDNITVALVNSAATSGNQLTSLKTLDNLTAFSGNLSATSGNLTATSLGILMATLGNLMGTSSNLMNFLGFTFAISGNIVALSIAGHCH
jgi:hypothetical protein